MKKTVYLLAIVGLFTFANSCKKEKKPIVDETPTTGEVKIEFEHVWGMNNDHFHMNEMLKQPKTGDSIKFTMLKYYVSNIQFKKSDGTWWSETESYHLIDVSNAASTILKIKNVPSGTYTEMKYMLGVDSTRNVSGAQTGALSTTNGMFWSWNSGYIFIKAEGESPNSSTGTFAYHIGGFSGANNVINTKSTNFNNDLLNVSKTASPQIHFTVNAARFWHSKSMSDVNVIHMPNANSKLMGTDFYDGFNYDHIHN